jgi:hypothetical protein
MMRLHIFKRPEYQDAAPGALKGEDHPRSPPRSSWDAESGLESRRDTWGEEGTLISGGN